MKNGVKNIQATAYNGARRVCNVLRIADQNESLLSKNKKYLKNLHRNRLFFLKLIAQFFTQIYIKFFVSSPVEQIG